MGHLFLTLFMVLAVCFGCGALDGAPLPGAFVSFFFFACVSD